MLISPSRCGSAKEIDLLKRESENHHKSSANGSSAGREGLTNKKKSKMRRIEMTRTAECDDLKAQLTNERKGHMTTIALQKRDDVGECLNKLFCKNARKSQLELEKLADKLARSLNA